MQVKYTPGLNCMIWSWSFTKLSENPLCELTSVKMWIHDPFWPQNINININIYGYSTVILSMSVSNMYRSRISKHFQLKWKMNVMHLLEADLSTGPFLLFGYSWWSLIFTVNHSDDSFFCCFARIHGYSLYVFFPCEWITSVKGCYMWKISGFTQFTAYCMWVRGWCMLMFG